MALLARMISQFTCTTAYLVAFVEECVPNPEVSLYWNVIHEDGQEPVKREERHVHLVPLQMCMKTRKLLRYDVFQHPLCE